MNKNQWFEIESEEQKPTRRNVTITEEGEKRKKNVLKVEPARPDVRKHFFTIRAAKIWNEIPAEVREKNSVNGFKASYDGWKRGNPNDV